MPECFPNFLCPSSAPKEPKNNLITMLDGLVKMDADLASINADAADAANAANAANIASKLEDAKKKAQIMALSSIFKK